jgi:uncharacterized membrane protein
MTEILASLTGMNGLIVGAAVFAAVHLLVAGTPLRAALVNGIGDMPYQGLFSVLSILGLVLMVYGYGGAQPEQLWRVPVVLDPAFGAVIMIGFILIVAGLTVKNPTLMGGEGALSRDDVASGFLRITRHPMMWGFTLWSGVHFLKNGDTRSVILFGTLLVVAVVGPTQIDKRRAAALGDSWDKFAAVTSNVPFAAIIQGRNSLQMGELGLWRIALGLGLFAAMFYFHPQITGVSLY